MLGETYKKLGQFQEILKKCIIDRFGGCLSQDKIDLLNSTNFVIESELVNFKTGAEIQGKILRDMLKSIIHIKCIKELTQENGKTTNIIYGEDIEYEIIEFYAANIADRYKFGIDSIDNRLSIAFELMDIFGSNFDNVMLNKNVNEILSMNEAAIFASNYNNNSTNTSEDVNIMDYVDSNPTNKPEENKSILSEEEYKNLCMKFARNEALSPEEFNKLLMATPDLLDENDISNISNTDENNINNQEVMSRGFTISSLSTYFVILAMLLLIVFGFLVL